MFLLARLEIRKSLCLSVKVYIHQKMKSFPYNLLQTCLKYKMSDLFAGKIVQESKLLKFRPFQFECCPKTTGSYQRSPFALYLWVELLLNIYSSKLLK